MPLLGQIGFAYQKFLLQQGHCLGGIGSKDLRNASKRRGLAFDNTGIGRYRNLAIRKRVQGIHRLVHRNPCRQLNFNFDPLGCVIHDFADLDFAALVGLEDGIDDPPGGGPKGNFPDEEGFFVVLLDTSPAADFSTTATVLVMRSIHQATGRKIRQQNKRLFAQDANRCLDEFDEIMGQNAGGQAHRNALHTLRQQQRKLGWQRNGFLLATIVGHLPERGSGIEQNHLRKFGQTGLDITRSGGRIPGTNIPPIALGFDQKILLAQANQGIPNRSVSVGVVLHGLTD